MKVPECIYWSLLILNFATIGSSLEPVTIAVGGIIGLGSIFAAALWEPVRCRLSPCCNSRWIINNLTAMEYNMKTNVHGQHLAISIVTQHLKAHLNADNPARALVLSFHGPTGVGKTFISNIIAQNLYRDGLHSNYVHLISAMRDFPHENLLLLYKRQLQSWTEGHVTSCQQSMFIFEEVDKLPAGLLDTLTPYLLHHRTSGGVNYHKAVYIFLSNTGSSEIVEAAFDHWKSGHSRETLKLSDLQKIILDAINHDKDQGLWQSQLISKNCISAFVPFLPLEKDHVERCIKDAVSADANLLHIYQPEKVIQHGQVRYTSPRKSIQNIVDEVMKQLTFSPIEEPVFSDMGCKRAIEKIYTVV